MRAKTPPVNVVQTTNDVPQQNARKELAKMPERPKQTGTVVDFTKGSRQTPILLSGQEYGYFLITSTPTETYISANVDGKDRKFSVRRTVVDGEERYTIQPTADGVYPFPLDLEFDSDLIDENPEALKLVKIPLFHPDNFAVVVGQVSALDQADFAAVYGHTLSNLFASMYLVESRRALEREIEFITSQVAFKKASNIMCEEEEAALEHAMRSLSVQPVFTEDGAGNISTGFCTHSSDLEYESRKIIRWLLSRWGRIVGRQNGKWVLTEIAFPEELDEYLAGDMLSRIYEGNGEAEIVQNAYLFITACAGLWNPQKQLETIRNQKTELAEVEVPSDDELKK
jgi:hypothetical protein